MKLCLTDCICPGGGCQMESCVNNCVDDHGDITPPLCIETAALAPSARDGLTPTAICIRDFLEMNALTPYVCERGAGYACCTNDVESVHQAGLGECTKDLKITEKVDKNDASSEDNSRRGNTARGISIGVASGIILCICVLLMIFCWKFNFRRSRNAQWTFSGEKYVRH